LPAGIPYIGWISDDVDDRFGHLGAADILSASGYPISFPDEQDFVCGEMLSLPQSQGQADMTPTHLQKRTSRFRRAGTVFLYSLHSVSAALFELRESLGLGSEHTQRFTFLLDRIEQEPQRGSIMTFGLRVGVARSERISLFTPQLANVP